MITRDTDVIVGPLDVKDTKWESLRDERPKWQLGERMRAFKDIGHHLLEPSCPIAPQYLQSLIIYRDLTIIDRPVWHVCFIFS